MNRFTLYLTRLFGTPTFRLCQFTFALLPSLIFLLAAALPARADLLVANSQGDSVLRYDEATDAFRGAFVEAGSGGLDQPRDMAFGPDGELYVASFFTDQVLRYDGATGAFLGVFVVSRKRGARRAPLLRQGTSDASKHPALHYVQENTSWFRLAWSQEGDIFYSEFFPDHGSLNWGTPTDLTAGYSWMISATRPSIVSGAWNSAFVVWEASKDQVVEEEDESPLSGAGGRRQVFLREKTSVWQPVTELSYYWGTDEITPVVGLDNSKVTVLWNWGVTGLAKASRDVIGSGWSIAHVGYGYWPALPGYTQTRTPLRMSTGVPGPPHAVQFHQDPPSSPLADSKAGEEPGVSGAGGGVLVSRTATPGVFQQFKQMAYLNPQRTCRLYLIIWV